MNNRQVIQCSLKIKFIILKTIFWVISLFLIYNLMVFIKAWIILPPLRQIIQENAQNLFIFFYVLAFVAWLCHRYAKVINNDIKRFNNENKEKK